MKEAAKFANSAKKSFGLSVVVLLTILASDKAHATDKILLGTQNDIEAAFEPVGQDTGNFSMTTPSAEKGTPLSEKNNNAAGDEPLNDLIKLLCPEIDRSRGIEKAKLEDLVTLYDLAMAVDGDSRFNMLIDKKLLKDIIARCERVIGGTERATTQRISTSQADKGKTAERLNEIIAQVAVNTLLAKFGLTEETLKTAKPDKLAVVAVGVEDALKKETNQVNREWLGYLGDDIKDYQRKQASLASTPTANTKTNSYSNADCLGYTKIIISNSEGYLQTDQKHLSWIEEGNDKRYATIRSSLISNIAAENEIIKGAIGLKEIIESENVDNPTINQKYNTLLTAYNIVKNNHEATNANSLLSYLLSRKSIENIIEKTTYFLDEDNEISKWENDKKKMLKYGIFVKEGLLLIPIETKIKTEAEALLKLYSDSNSAIPDKKMLTEREAKLKDDYNVLKIRFYKNHDVVMQMVKAEVEALDAKNAALEKHLKEMDEEIRILKALTNP